MRLTCLLTVLLAFSATASVNAQQGKVTIDVKSATLSQVLMEVKDQTGAKILYNENLLRDVECKDLKLEGVAVEEALNQILAHTPFGYTMENGVVVIQKRSAEPQNVMVVRGRVVDKSHKPIPGVTVMIQGTPIGFITDKNGNFAFEMPQGQEITLLFSFVGMKSVAVKYEGQEDLRVVMEEEVTEIDEVVVTGYQTLSRSRNTVFLDCSVRWQTPWRLEFILSGKNLLGQKYFYYQIDDGLDTYTTEYSLRPASVTLKLRWTLR